MLDNRAQRLPGPRQSVANQTIGMMRHILSPTYSLILFDGSLVLLQSLLDLLLHSGQGLGIAGIHLLFSRLFVGQSCVDG